MHNTTIEQVFEQFLDSKSDLSDRKQRECETGISFFRSYLNTYAPSELNKADEKLWERESSQGREYCDLFGPERISRHDISMFLNWFMIRKVFASKHMSQQCARAMKDFTRWLVDHGFVPAEEAADIIDTAKRSGKEVPRCRELANRLGEFAESQNVEAEDEWGDYFEITKIAPGRLWFEPMGGDRIGPIHVPEHISDLAEEGWTVCMTVTKWKRAWHILDVANVYPR